MVKPWDTATIGAFLDFKNGLNKGKDFFGHGTPIINYTDVYKKRGLKKNDVCGKVSLTRDEIHRFDAQKNDVFFTRTSETPEEVGMSSVLLEDIDDCVFSGFVLRGRPKNDMFVPEYCKYCFTTEAVRSAIIMGCTYTTRALTNGKQLSTIEIVVPPKPEQEAIAKSLTEIDELISSLEKLITKKKAIKQGAMQELLTGKRRLHGFNGAWQEVKLEDICSKITDGSHESPPESDVGYYMPSVKDMRSTGFDYSECKKISYSDFKKLERNGCQPNIGDVLIAKDGSILKYAFVQEKTENIVILSSIAIVTPHSNCVDSYFLAQYFRQQNFVEQVITNYKSGTGVPRIVLKGFKQIVLFIPESVAEQAAIAKILVDMDTEITGLENELAKYRQVKQGMMQQLLTGKIRLA